jgi:ferredoxin
MAYVITDACIKDELCVDVCPTDCIHPKKDEPGFEEATQLFVDPNGCIDCGACVPACTSDSIRPVEELSEEEKPFIEKNAAYFSK